jgi:hypothetical protein
MPLLKLERISKLGRLGEDLVAERLQHRGYSDIDNLNVRRHNYPFGDLLATTLFHRRESPERNVSR